ncbi:subtilisin-like serine protease [Ceratobasidium sp. 428]|nr:subtilisin-like serine protease [Ceratobasidium sp. 428]
MMFTTALSAFFLVAPVMGAPTLVPITKRAGPVKPDSFIVTFKDVIAKKNFLGLGSRFDHSGSTIVYDYDVIPAIAVNLMSVQDINIVRQHSGVESIEHNGIVSIEYEAGLDGLDFESPHRSSNRPRPSSLGKRNAGDTSVVGYSIDTGVFCGHDELKGHCTPGATFLSGTTSPSNEDENGHGTHTSCIIAGKSFGQAPGVEIVSVRVLDASGSGSNADVVKGIDWVVAQQVGNKAKVMNLSLGTLILLGYPVGQAAKNAIAKGIHVVVAAGNNGAPTLTSSPANVPEAITVGAIDSSNQRASFSNFGVLIDVWAPGVSILSCWIGGPSATEVLSGTSMAAPYVAGILAVEIEKYGNKSPEDLSNDLKANAKPDVQGQIVGTNLRAQKW